MDSRSASSSNNNNNSNSYDVLKADASLSTGIPAYLSPLEWFNDKAMSRKRLNFPDFVSAFGYWREQDAHDAFMNLLSTSALPQRVWTAASNEYEIWRRNDGKEYWASRAILSQLSMSAKRTAVGVISKSEHIIKTKLGSSLDQEQLDDSEHESGTEDKASLHKAGQKHPRDPWGGLDGVPLKTPHNASPSPTVVPTENIDSPSMIQSGGTIPNPFQEDNTDELEEDDEQLDAAEEDENNGQDFLLPDKVEQELNFVGELDGLELASGFEPFFVEVKKKAVYIEDTDEVLGRSGIIFLANDGSALQQQHFGTAGLDQIRQKMLKYWCTSDVAASRSKLIKDKKYDRSQILIDMTKSPPSDPIDLKLWLFLLGAVSKFPVKDMTKLYSELTGLSSYVLPLCQVFMGDPEKMVFFNFVDKTTMSGKSRTGTKSKREPDLVLELKDQSNKTICELGLGEGTSHAHKNYRKKNAKDLARIGLGLKDALDLIQDKYDVDDATLVGYQVIAQIMSIYLMRRCGNGSNIYVMIHVDDVLIPDSLKDLPTIGMDYNLWFELAMTVGNGIKPVLDAAAKGTVVADRPPMGAGKARIHTTSTPDLNKLLKRV
ncbi:hypothetical protein BG003_000308 [Podila horticola]|nr:hypothetical protein BG003_000308 [Podila horticola]